MPAKILSFTRAQGAPGLPLDELHELDGKLTLLCFALERCSSGDFVTPSRNQLAALSHQGLQIQSAYQQLARRVLAFAGHPAAEGELTMADPAMERLQRAALFGDPLDGDGE